MANWREFLFWIQERPQFTQTTYVSLFGLCNIQRLGEECSLADKDFNNKLEEIMGYSAIMIDGHHFKNRENFSMKNGQLCMHDYGNRRVQAVLRKMRDRIREKLKTVI